MFQKKLFFLISILILFFQNNILSFENKILLKIDNEIITSVDVLNEMNFLKIVNKKINKISDEEIYQISLNSLIKEKIKKIEVLKNYDTIEIEEKFLNNLIESTYQNLGFNKFEIFQAFLNENNINFDEMKDRIAIDALWNEIIFFKFSKKVKIDKEKLKNKIVKKNNQIIKSYLLSEIVFNLDEKLDLDEKYNQIKESISSKGFENSALIFSISNTSNSGGDLGWINENSLSLKLQKEISKLSVGELTKPIIIPGGFLILQLNDLKEIENKIDIDKELKRLITKETNQQLNQFSNMYFNKIKKEIQINEI
tara:strand:- start:313 stop:1245 length:933 start_codon:yes stop_codon:yes gene_type:complete